MATARGVSALKLLMQTANRGLRTYLEAGLAERHGQALARRCRRRKCSTQASSAPWHRKGSRRSLGHRLAHDAHRRWRGTPTEAAWRVAWLEDATTAARDPSSFSAVQMLMSNGA